MILTAQRVRPLPGHTQAIHSYYHRHDSKLRRNAAGGIDVNAVSQQHRTLVRQRVRLRVGGNAVDSYLDVIAEDDARIEDLDAAVQAALKATRADRASYQSYSSSSVSIAFYVSPRITAAGRSISDEVEELWSQSRGLFLQTVDRNPLTVLIEADSKRWLLHLDDKSAKRVREVLGDDWTQPRIDVDHDTRVAFESTGRSLFLELVPALTGLEPSVVQELGGIRFVDAKTGKTRYDSA